MENVNYARHANETMYITIT